MKTRIIPAQITTVEDKIAGNLNFTQIILLIAAVLLSTGIFVILPEPMKFAFHKLLLILTVFVVFGILALRIKERVILNWVVLLAVYAMRPKTFVFNKNSHIGRNHALVSSNPEKSINVSKTKVSLVGNFERNRVDISEIVRSKNISIRLGPKGAVAIKSI